jgi:hypothetical protein
MKDSVRDAGNRRVAAKADHAILSSNKFPAGERQILFNEGVIIASTARIQALAGLLRDQIVSTPTPSRRDKPVPSGRPLSAAYARSLTPHVANAMFQEPKARIVRVRI